MTIAHGLTERENTASSEEHDFCIALRSRGSPRNRTRGETFGNDLLGDFPTAAVATATAAAATAAAALVRAVELARQENVSFGKA